MHILRCWRRRLWKRCTLLIYCSSLTRFLHKWAPPVPFSLSLAILLPEKKCASSILCTNKKSLLSYHSYFFFHENSCIRSFATPEGGLERKECSSQCAACGKKREVSTKNIIHYNYDAIHLWVSISCELSKLYSSSAGRFF